MKKEREWKILRKKMENKQQQKSIMEHFVILIGGRKESKSNLLLLKEMYCIKNFIYFWKIIIIGKNFIDNTFAEKKFWSWASIGTKKFFFYKNIFFSYEWANGHKNFNIHTQNQLESCVHGTQNFQFHTQTIGIFLWFRQKILHFW